MESTEHETQANESASDDILVSETTAASITTPTPSKADVLEFATFCQYVPLRLSPEERVLLQVMEQCLNVSEYTDHVDVAGRRGNKVRRILDGILEAAHIATGLIVASGKEPALCDFLITSMAPGTAIATSSGTPTDSTTASHSHAKGSGKDQISRNGKMKAKSKPKRNGTVAKLLRGKGSGKPPIVLGNAASKHPKENAVLLQAMFEVGRRNKVLNPSSMRTTYGKLMYLLQDAQSPTVAKSLGFSLHKDLLLVAPYLQDHDCDALLKDPRLIESTRVVGVSHGRRMNGGNGSKAKLSRQEIDEIHSRQRAMRQELVQEYSTPHSKLSPDQVERVLESIRDAISYVDANVRPVQTMLEYLEDNFDPHAPESSELSLQLTGGSRMSPYSSNNNLRYGFSAFSTSGSTGPTLSHSHSTQYTFCWQSLRLWQKVQRHMHKLWVCADEDLLSTSTSYQLYNTGQGLHRVQSCPSVAKVMRSLLTSTQSEAGAPWVGLSVIHLGDRDVPNALVFIDKYTQIPRFLNPICSFLHDLDTVTADEAGESNVVFKNYITTNFGTPDRLRKLVLCDYFKHGFDGSGDDGGSCIDGRLTSSWNWTSLIAKKKYYHAFMMSGFQGFDGDFK
ncbi:Protein of unknown function (DUF2009) [Fragilaria crotonensis]|nr:Protein of unknown function (DUF2009) [Fragilaria crotonensis]